MATYKALLRQRNQERLQDCYERRHAECAELISELNEGLGDLTDPESDALRWGHVGSLQEVVTHLRHAVDELRELRRHA